MRSYHLSRRDSNGNAVPLRARQSEPVGDGECSIAKACPAAMPVNKSERTWRPQALTGMGSAFAMRRAHLARQHSALALVTCVGPRHRCSYYPSPTRADQHAAAHSWGTHMHPLGCFQ
jgi:hypothetical protein